MTALDVLVVTAADRERALAGGWAGIAALPACETCSGTPSEPCPEPGCNGCGRPRPCPDCTDGTRTPERVAIVAPCGGCHAGRTWPVVTGEFPRSHKHEHCEGGGMLLYGVAEVTEALPYAAHWTSAPGRHIRDWLSMGLHIIENDAEGMTDHGEIHIDQRIGEFAPGGLALRLAAARLVTAPGGCPACDGDKCWWCTCTADVCRGCGVDPRGCVWCWANVSDDDPDETSCPGGRRCGICGGTGSLPAPWAAPGLPSTPGLHRPVGRSVVIWV